MVSATSAPLVTRIPSRTRKVDQFRPSRFKFHSRGLFLRGIATAPLNTGPRDLLSWRTLYVARAKMPWHLAFINVCRHAPLASARSGVHGSSISSRAEYGVRGGPLTAASYFSFVNIFTAFCVGVSLAPLVPSLQ